MRLFFLCLILVVAVNPGVPAQTSSGGAYSITRHTVDAGGGRSSGGAFVLAGTSGQTESGQVSSGGAYALRSGFWSGGEITPPTGVVFRDSFED